MSSYLLLQEITDWSTPNHIYITNESKSKVFGYVMAPGKSAVIRFAKPMMFDTRSRKFRMLAKFDA